MMERHVINRYHHVNVTIVRYSCTITYDIPEAAVHRGNLKSFIIVIKKFRIAIKTCTVRYFENRITKRKETRFI